MEHYKKQLRALVCVLFVLALIAVTVFGGFDAQGYTQASLDQIFQGEVEGMLEFDKDASKKELKKQYEQYIALFAGSLTQGLNASETMSGKFYELCKEIFRTTKYSVLSEEKITDDQYEVTVEIQPVDTFPRWNESLADSVKGIAEKVQNGEYKGSQQEILEAMLFDITTESYELMETACSEAEYKEKETMILTVEKDENGEFGLKAEEISLLIMKILCLDEIQD